MTDQNDTEVLPVLVVSKVDYDALTGLAGAVEERLPEVARVLQSEMDRAHVVAPDAVPADVVRMGSTVEFRPDNGRQRTVTLVFPGDADIAEGRISILTPIGAALIGLSAGQSMAWTARDGRRQRLTVLQVGQPAAGASAPA
ncbi:MAG: nucleoside diphosphate kinase regulator [Hyphomicrobiaceae bacterium]